MTEDDMVGWRHRLDGNELEQALGDGEGQRSLACCSPCGHEELDMTERVEQQRCLLIILFKAPAIFKDN